MAIDTKSISWMDFWQQYNKTPKKFKKLIENGRCLFGDGVVILINALRSQTP